MVSAAIEISDQIEKIGSYAGFAAFFGLAVLTLLYFAQARELKRLRDWAGRAPERAQELESRVLQQAEAARRVHAQPRAVPPAAPQTAAAQATPATAAVAAGTPAPATAAATAAGAATATEDAPAKDAEKPAEADAKDGDAKPAEAAKADAPEGEAAATDGEKPDAAQKPDAKPAVDGDQETDESAPVTAPAANGVPPATPTPVPPPASAPPPPPSLPSRPLPPRAAPPRPGAPAASPLRSGATASRRPPARRPPGAPPPREADGDGRGAGRTAIVAGAAALGLVLLVVGAVSLLGGDDGGSETATTPSPAATADATPDAARTPASTARADTTVAVLNGTTVEGLASGVAERVTSAGYAQGTIGNYRDQARSVSLVFYTDAPNARRAATEVAKVLEIPEVQPASESETEQAPGAQVIVVVGADQAP